MTNVIHKISWVTSVFAWILAFPLLLSGQKNSCIECHKELGGELSAPVEAFKQDIHQQFGLGCRDCHGGNPSQDDMDLAKDKSFKGAPSRLQNPEFCAACHSSSDYMKNYNPNLRVDQLSLYWTSQHGRLLKKGDTNVAVCTDCHRSHGIQTSSFPKSLTFPWNVPRMCGECHSSQEHMKNYKIPVNQDEDYEQSVHARALFEKKDLSAPTCNDCHGNHGAAPPEVTSIAYVCRQCHPSAGELFSKSPHKKAYDELRISECEACHGNHKILTPTDEMLATGKNDVCQQCHDPGSRPYGIAAGMKGKIDAFIGRFESVDELLKKAEKQGVEVSEPKFKLQEANTMLIFVRNLTHSLSLDEIDGKIAEGEEVLSSVRRAAEEALREAKFRKTGLIIATLFIILLAIALIQKIRQLNAKKAP